jgi:SAM-dependent methyltransferase
MDPKERFSDRVDDYERYRPGYPQGLSELLVHECGLGPKCSAADIGSGTGILTRVLLATGASVFGVEPNAPMRAAAERALSPETRFTSVDGSAEATALPSGSVELIAAGQAFHWFEPERTRLEFARILKPGGSVVLVWNQRKDTSFGRAYEEMLDRFAPDYAYVRTRDRAAESSLRTFFAPATPVAARFDNEQRFDEAGLRGRLLSSSYAPQVGHPMHTPIMGALAEIFRTHAQGGAVTFAYDTTVWYARPRW